MLCYSSDNSKWNAYQFNDPFASDKFIVCNKTTKTCCRPNCDLSIQTSLKSEIKFADTIEEAVNSGYTKCPHCLIPNDNNDLNAISIDVSLLINTVATVNEQIGFTPPLDDEDPLSETIRQSILKKSKLRRGSVPAIHLNGHDSLSKNTSSSVSKNETDHVKLVDLACRHIALAAASTAVQVHEDQTDIVKKQQRQLMEQEQQLLEERITGGKKRRRRGGVLGFKELASKSKLSPWHFHRVFKSVTGLTPKVYGDKCFDIVKKHIDQHGSFSSQKAITISTNISNPTSSPAEEQLNALRRNSKSASSRNHSLISKLSSKSAFKTEDGDIFSPEDSDPNRGSPFSSTADDFVTTPQSMNYVSGKSYTSPAITQKPEVNFGQYSMIPSLSQVNLPLRDEMQFDLSAFDSTFNADVANMNLTNTVPLLQPLLEDNLSNIPMMPTVPLTGTLSTYPLTSTLDLSNTKDLSSELFLPENFSLDLTDIQIAQTNNFNNTFNSQSPMNLNANSTNNKFFGNVNTGRANSDTGEYIQTPLNFDLNSYGYFDLTNIDPLEALH